MSANLPPSFKPIAHYIKIANENASRDPVIYYWSLLHMAMIPYSTAPLSEFNDATWRRLQTLILEEKKCIETRDALRDSIDNPDETMQMHMESLELSEKIQEKSLNCEVLREKIAKINQKILIGQRKIGELDEKLKKKQEDEEKLERKVTTSKKHIEQNLEKKTQQKRVISIMIRLDSYRKLTMIKEVFEIFQLKIDGGPASNLQTPRTCNCQVVDFIRGHHLPQLTHIFNHPELPTLAALHNSIHIFDVITKILNFAPKTSTELLFSNVKNWKKRVDREKFVEAMTSLGRNITQLREACGIPTMATDRPLGTLEEWIRLIIMKKTVFERPVNSLFYAVQTAMKLDKSSVEARQYLTGLLTTLEAIKSQLADNEAIKNETIAQAHIESFAEKLFNFADKKEKAGTIDKSVVHAFYTAGHVMDILALFGEIDEPFLSSKKYAKWKSTQIFTCLRDGTPYVPSSQQETNEDDELAQFGAQFQPGAPSSSGPQGGPQEHSYNQPPAPGFGFGGPGIPNVPSDHSLPPQPPARQNIPPPPSYSSTPNLPSQHQPYPPANARHQPQQYEDFSTPAQPPKSSGATPTDEEFSEIRKLTKYAMSAVDYEDVKAIRDNLNKALAILARY
ncbi:hypothetical protein CAEBREN_31669 [Caenorhabditis brenneri]|uniref:Uncharacterized protein n=1 Tax=Caenorhabditis brenneri TaxID=135651 RepID=G0P1E7_CAEBE|nr:hypothetical protein CAEBREN_31669 [Caenorhabditis brenneri]